MAPFELCIQWDHFTDTCRSKATIRDLGKILKNLLRRSLFSYLIKLNASNYHLLKMNSTEDSQELYLNFVQFVMACLNFQNPLLGNTFWWLLLYLLEALVFQNTSKWMLSSLSNRAIFFAGYFDLKNYQKRQVHLLSLSFPCWDGIPLLLFIMFSRLRSRCHCPKTFLYWRNLKILISLTWQTFSINHYIHKTYLHKKIYISRNL